jgi:hypothetical protein
MDDWNAKWEAYKRQYPVNVCVICDKCKGSSASDCECAKQRWIDKQRWMDVTPHVSAQPPPMQPPRSQCFWCKTHVDNVASIVLLSKPRDLCAKCVMKLVE